jgi:uncharacterized protein YqgC (DUF456 family)
LPGIPLAWLGFFIYAVVTGFQKISVLTTIVFFIVMLVTLAMGYFAPMLGAKKHKASKIGILGSFLGLTFGILVFGFWGIILGPFLGAFLGELIAKREPGQAIKSGFGTLVGFVAGTLLQVIVIFIMAGFFLSSLF